MNVLLGKISRFRHQRIESYRITIGHYQGTGALGTHVRYKKGDGYVYGDLDLIDLSPTFLDMAAVGENERLAMDGRSLMGLLDGDDLENWVVFSEYHAQGCHAPCFMIRQGQYKYVYIHDYESQLFDLEADPGEWHNLAGNPEYKEIETQLKTRMLEKFDPDAIEEAGRKADLPIMFHHEPREIQPGYPEGRTFRKLVLEKMKPGDTHTHCYGAAYPIMLGDSPPDQVNPDVFKAKERGIFFDVGHGGGSFVFRHAVPSIQQGHIADAISTDLYGTNTNRDQ